MPIESNASPVGQTSPSLLTAFRPELFVERRSWQRMAEILNGGGGSFGLSGPRGSGKSWLIAKAKAWADDDKQKGLGVLFPSPSEYEPFAFLAAISDVVAESFEQHHDYWTGRPSRIARRRFFSVAGIGSLIALLGVFIYYVLYDYNSRVANYRTYCQNGGDGRSYSDFCASAPKLTSGLFRYAPLAVLAVLVIVGATMAGVAFLRYRHSREGSGRVRQDAEELRRQVQFIVTTKESSEVGAEGKQGGFVARLKRARERQLVERPATLSSLVHRFRTFVESIAKVVPGPVVIGVDELDKMTDPERVSALLRDIKGIFEISGVYFLVSISNEAARSLELGAVRTRNEFNSSFYTVLSLGSFEPSDCVELLTKRDKHFNPEVARVLGVLSGGVAREVVRLAELASSSRDVQNSSTSESRDSVLDAVFIIMTDELRAFLDEVLVTSVAEGSGGSSELEKDKLSLYRSIPSNVFDDRRAFLSFASMALRLWRLEGMSNHWEEKHAEQWRRLLIRLTAAATIINSPTLRKDSDQLRRLQEIVKSASASAAVARAQLMEYRFRRATQGKTRITDNQIDLLSQLIASENGFSSVRDYASNRNISYRTVRRDLQVLESIGALKRQRRGYSSVWYCIEDGGLY